MRKQKFTRDTESQIITGKIKGKGNRNTRRKISSSPADIRKEKAIMEYGAALVADSQNQSEKNVNYDS